MRPSAAPKHPFIFWGGGFAAPNPSTPSRPSRPVLLSLGAAPRAAHFNVPRSPRCVLACVFWPNTYTSDDKYLAVITNNGLWIKDNIITGSSTVEKENYGVIARVERSTSIDLNKLLATVNQQIFLGENGDFQDVSGPMILNYLNCTAK